MVLGIRDALAPNQECPYCCCALDESSSPEEEHFIPHVFYVEDVPRNEKPRVRACKKCNREKSKVDQRCWLELAVCLPMENPIYSDMVAKALRSMNPESARTDDQDRTHRQAQLEAMLSKTRTVHDESGFSPIPLLMPPDTGPDGERAIIEMDRISWDKWLSFVIRGIWTFGTLEALPLDTQIGFQFENKEFREETLEGLKTKGLPPLPPFIDMGVTFKANVVFDTNHHQMVADIIIWDILLVIAFVARPNTGLTDGGL